jgi:hypothetical protein
MLKKSHNKKQQMSSISRNVNGSIYSSNEKFQQELKLIKCVSQTSMHPVPKTTTNYTTLLSAEMGGSKWGGVS